MASKRLERRKDKFKFTATYVEADQYSMMTRPDHWSEHKYVPLQIPVFNCLHCFHPFSRHLCECQQLCQRLFVGNYTQSERRTCRFLRLLKSQPKSAQFCFQMLEDASAKYLLLSYPQLIFKLKSSQNSSIQLRSWRQANFLSISNRLSRWHPPLPPPKYQMSRLSLQFVETVRNLGL